MISPFDFACKILKYSAKTEKEITDRLRTRKLDETEIKQTVEKLKKYNFLNDTRYITEYIESKLESGYGLELIKEKLLEKGIEETLLKQVAKELNLGEEQELASASKVLEKKLKTTKGQTGEKLKAKLENFLQSRGFPEHIIETVVADSSAKLK